VCVCTNTACGGHEAKQDILQVLPIFMFTHNSALYTLSSFLIWSTDLLLIVSYIYLLLVIEQAGRTLLFVTSKLI